MPCVLHVAARALAQHALSIFGDHQVCLWRQGVYSVAGAEHV